MIGNARIGIKEITNICLDIFTVFLSLFLVFPFVFAFAINWVVCTMHINVIGYWQCTLVLFHQISLQCSFPFVILKCLTDFFSAILVIYRLGCITFYLLPLFAEQALRSIFNISHSESVTWKHQYIKANITSV